MTSLPALTPVEAAIRARLGVPETATNVFIMSQSSHLDWDWKITFPQLYFQPGQPDDMTGPGSDYFNQGLLPGQHWVQPASQIFSDAAQMLAQHPDYYYSICEMGFLQSFCNDPQFAAQAKVLAGSANFQTVGGGITSPDNLITHGEAFIRNFLSGWLFVGQTFATPPKLQCWLPDDFGHDSQLPVVLRAMGMQGVGFERVPNGAPVDGSKSVAAQLDASGVDFVWTAADGSTVLAHWLNGGYCQGDGIFNDGTSQQQTPIEWIRSYLTADALATITTPYLFLPVGCDFRVPQALPNAAADWNANVWAKGLSPYYVVCATFDDYVQLVNQHAAELPIQPMYATPYWTGCYAMRPEIKRGHYDSTRTLLAAEAFDQSLPGAAHAPQLANAWADLAPTTHHDFIPGSASVVVYRAEQQPLLTALLETTGTALDAVLSAVAARIDSSPQSGEVPFVVFNPLGAVTSRLVEVPPSFGPFGGFASVRSGTDYYPVQIAADGALLFFAAVPSVGWSVFYLSPEPPTVSVQAASVAAGQGSYTLANESLSATVEAAQSWNLTAFEDLIGSTSVIAEPANAISIYSDTGDNYEFGCEGGDASNFQPVGSTVAGGASVVENGPLRCTVTTEAAFTAGSGAAYTYRRTYTLVGGEPFLRMSLTGAAPNVNDVSPGSAVVVAFPLASTITGIAQGTAAHWTAQPQVFYWQGAPAFQPTRDYVIAGGANGPQAALYHGSVPAWGLNAYGGTNVLAGCLLRNTYPTYNDDLNSEAAISWGGTDPEPHTLEYALRIPSGIAAPSAGQALYEARSYATPAYVMPVSGASGTLPATGSLASAQAANGGFALVAALKAGTFEPAATFVRVYDPSNVFGNTIVVDLDGLVAAQGGGAFTVQIVTALEQPIADQDPQPYTAGGFAFAAQGALTTLKIAPA